MTSTWLGQDCRKCRPKKSSRRFDECGRKPNRHWGITILAGYLALAGYVAATSWSSGGRDSPEVDLTALLPGGPPNRTLQSVHSTVALAEQINAIPRLSARVLTADARDTWKPIAGGAYGSKLAPMPLPTSGNSAIARCTTSRSRSRRHAKDLKCSSSPLRPFIAAGATMQQTRLQESTAARAALDELHRICPSRWRRAILQCRGAGRRFLAKAREDTRFCRTQLYGFSREVMGRLGSDLAAAGWLDSPDDYVHLEAEELLGAFEGTSTHRRSPRLGTEHGKTRFCSHAVGPPLRPIFTTGALPIDIADLRRRAANTSATAGPSTELSGLPSSAGIARGQAKLVLRPDVRPDDCAGRILVARETDPGWLPLMLNAAGLVAERGSMLSHTAITGRMLGVPTIVAVSEATTSK